jgi:1-phosphofructokinase
MVFAPAPLLTVTLERRADADELHVHPGGQGVWQARMLASLGCRVSLCAGVGGEIGGVLEGLLGRLDPQLSLHAVAREAGSGWYVHDRRDGERAEIAEETGAPLARHDLDELYSIALVEGLRADVSVLSGPAEVSLVDPGMYRRLAADLRANGGVVVADLNGELLDAVLAGGVAFVKVSHEQLIGDGRADGDGVPALVRAGRDLLAQGAGAVLISRAGEPALALFDDRVVTVHVPRLEVVDSRGAGDSMSAGVAATLAAGGGTEEAIRTGAAAGALNVTRHGLGTGPGDAVRELVGRVHIEEVSCES